MNKNIKKYIRACFYFFVTVPVAILVFKGISFQELFKKEIPQELNRIELRDGNYDLYNFLTGESVGDISINLLGDEININIKTIPYSGVITYLSKDFSFNKVDCDLVLKRRVMKLEEVFFTDSGKYVIIIGVDNKSRYLPEKIKNVRGKIYLVCELDSTMYGNIERQMYSMTTSEALLIDMYLSEFAAFFVQ